MNDDEKKKPERSDILIRKAIHKALFTRKEPVKQAPKPGDPPEVNPMLKRFNPGAIPKPAVQPPIVETPEVYLGPDLDPLFEPEPPSLIPPLLPKKRPPVPVTEPVPDLSKIDPDLKAMLDEDTAEASVGTVDEFAEYPKEEKRTKPLPKVRMVPKKGFWATLKSKLVLPISSKVSRKNKEIKTGLTNRQRIKRYNSSHEGGYNSPASRGAENNGN